MFFYLPISLYSLIFLVFLELVNRFKFDLETFAGNRPYMFLTTMIVGILIFSIFYKKVVNKTSLLVIPMIFSLSTIFLLYLADLKIQEQSLIILGSGMFYVSMVGAYRIKACTKDQTARGLIAGSLAATIFFFYDAMNGLYINFPIPLWFMMLAYLTVTTLVSFEYFAIMENVSKRMALIYSLIIGISMAEILLIMAFWPFTYLTTGAIALIFYYVLWDLAQCHFLCKLNQKRVMFNMLFLGSLVGLILLSTRWMTVV